MPIASPLGLNQVLNQFNRQKDVAGLFSYEGECQLALKSALASIPKSHIDDFWLFVGSEGGFSGEEVILFQRTGLEPVSLGSQILRVETACLALVSIIQYEFDALM